MSFWPSDLFAKDIRSPMEILQSIAEELASQTPDLKADIIDTPVEDRVVISFNITNIKYGLIRNLFEVTHRPDQSYPVVIQPPASDIPDYLKRKLVIHGSPGFSGIGADLASRLGALGHTRTIENEWVCASPHEFKEKIKKLLALDHVISILYSLIAPSIPLRMPGEFFRCRRGGALLRQQTTRNEAPCSGSTLRKTRRSDGTCVSASRLLDAFECEMPKTVGAAIMDRDQRTPRNSFVKLGRVSRAWLGDLGRVCLDGNALSVVDCIYLRRASPRTSLALLANPDPSHRSVCRGEWLNGYRTLSSPLLVDRPRGAGVVLGRRPGPAGPRPEG